MSNKKLISSALLIALVSALTLSSCSEPKVEAGFAVPLDDPTVYCDLTVQKSPTDIPSQTVAILAPTNNFVDFTTVVTRAETPVKDTLGGNLPESQLKKAIGREFAVVLADGKPKMVAKRSVQPLGESAYDITSAVDSTFGIFKLANKCAAGDLKRENDQVQTHDGSDMLKALSIAADQLTVSGEKNIFVKLNIQLAVQLPINRKEKL